MSAALIVGLFGLWITASVISQIPGLRERFDHTAVRVLLPSWSLFTDPMIRFDFTLMSRVELDEGEFSDWTIHDMAPDIGPQRVLWNPPKRLAARFREAVTMILSVRMFGQREGLDESPQVLALASYVSGQHRAGERVQFCVAMDDASRDETDASVLYMSKVFEA